MKTKYALLSLLFCLMCARLFAAEIEPNNTPATATTLALNGSNTGAVTPTTDLDYWKVTTTSDGLLALTLTSNDAVYLDLHIYDNNGTTELNSVLTTNATATLSTDGLAAGTYYVLVEIHFAGQTNTSYTLSDALTPAPVANDVEPNNKRSQATALGQNKTKTGHCDYYYNLQRDSSDWYKITTNADGALKLILSSSNAQYIDCQLFDNNGTTIVNSLFNTNSSTFQTTDGLSAGTYYVRLTPHFGNGFIPYTITDSLLLPAVANDAEPNNNRAQALSLGVNGSASGHCDYYYNLQRDSSDWYTFTTTSDGAVKLILKSWNTQYIDCILYDNNGVVALNTVFNSNATSTQTTDGLAAGTYYLKLTPHFANGFIPYTITDSLFLPAVTNDAEPDNNRSQALPLALNGSASGHCDYYYNLQRDSSDWYKITTTSDGAVKLILKSWNTQYIDCQLYDNNGIILLNSVFNSNTTTSQTTDGLAAGTYYLKLSPHFANGFIPYTITDSLFAAPVPNDIEPNGSRALAQTLALGGSTTGHVDYYYNNLRDSSDWYKLTTNLDGMIQLTLTSSNGQYVDATLYDNDGVTPVNTTMVINSTGMQNTDGLGAGTYYIKVFNHFANGFIPYTLSNNFFAYTNNNDKNQEPNDIAKQAKTLTANKTTGGHVDFYYNLTRNTVDWWKINYTGNSGNLTITYGDEAWLNNGSIPYVDWNVYKDTSAAPISTSLFNTASNAVNLTGLSKGYYWIKVNNHFANNWISYSINPSWTQSDCANISLTTANSGSNCTNSSLTYKCTGSHAPYSVQLYQYGLPLGNSATPDNTGSITFSSLAPGLYYATVFGDGASGSCFSTSSTSTLMPKIKGENTTNITGTSATLNWTTITCVKYYSVQYRVTGASKWTKKKTHGNVGTYQLNGLTLSTQYDWRVAGVDTANNQTATGKYSATTNFTTLAAKGGNELTQDVPQVDIYPNPASGEFRIDYTGSDDVVSLMIKDASGRTVWSNLNISTSSLNNQTIDVSKFSAGIYIVQMINSNHDVITKKLVIANK